MSRYLVCVTGASGAPYAARTIGALCELGHEVFLAASVWGERVFEEETGEGFRKKAAALGVPAERIFAADDLAAPPSSGSFRLDGTVVVPCSMSTAGAVASGVSINLIHRAALVSLKEGRPLVLVPRETPLSLVNLRNLTALAEAGAAIVPASPAFYHKPLSVADMVDFVAGRILDRLKIDHDLYNRWGA